MVFGKPEHVTQDNWPVNQQKHGNNWVFTVFKID